MKELFTATLNNFC